jgi:hypothetical protein
LIGWSTLNRNVERVFNPDRKDKHWGKEKIEAGRVAPEVRVLTPQLFCSVEKIFDSPPSLANASFSDPGRNTLYI